MNEAKQADNARLSSEWQWARHRMSVARNVIDLGCGPWPLEYARTGVDLFVEADQRGSGAKIDVPNLEKKGFRFVNSRIDAPLPFADKEFDFAYSSHVFEHLEEPEIACREMMRIAEAGVIITPSIFGDIAFGRLYHRWLMIAGANTLFFFEKLPEEDRPFGEHPNPFDALLNYGGWNKDELDSTGRELRTLLQNNWTNRSAAIEVVFAWEGSFDFHVERRRKSYLHLPAGAVLPPAPAHDPFAVAGAATDKEKSDHGSNLSLMKLLAEADLSNTSVRHSPELAGRLRAAGMQDTWLDDFWERIRFVADSSWGSVLEIGAGCGNTTRYIADSATVSRVVAIDTRPEFFQVLESLRLPKVEAHLALAGEGAPIGDYDSVVLAGAIENMTLDEELALLRSIKSSLRIGANFVIAAAIATEAAPGSARGFSHREFVDHLQNHYGPILRLTDNGAQQFAIVTYLGESP